MKKNNRPALSATVDSAIGEKPRTEEKLNVSRKAGHPVGQSDDLSADELRKILALPDKRKKDELRDYAVLLVLANTPMRKGELVSLKLGNLVDEGKTQYLTYVGLKKRSKRKYWLKIPIGQKVYEGIRRYVESENKSAKLEHDAPLFFTLGKHGPYTKKKITPRAIDKIVHKYVKKAGINKRITPHSFRATYLTLRAKGHDPASLLGLSGHASLAGLSPYLRGSEEKRREAALSQTVV